MSFEWRKKIYLTCQHQWWHLTNEAGTDLTDPQQFSDRVEAIAWAEAWVSSWPTKVELIVKDDQP